MTVRESPVIVEFYNIDVNLRTFLKSQINDSTERNYFIDSCPFSNRSLIK